MSLVSAFTKQIMIAENGTPMSLSCVPIAMGGATYASVATNIESWVEIGGGTGRLTLSLSGSNDGVAFSPITAFATSYTAEGQVITSADVATAFIRLDFALDQTAGTGGDSTAIAFSCQVNMVHK